MGDFLSICVAAGRRLVDKVNNDPWRFTSNDFFFGCGMVARYSPCIRYGKLIHAATAFKLSPRIIFT